MARTSLADALLAVAPRAHIRDHYGHKRVYYELNNEFCIFTGRQMVKIYLESLRNNSILDSRNEIISLVGFFHYETYLPMKAPHRVSMKEVIRFYREQGILIQRVSGTRRYSISKEGYEGSDLFTAREIKSFYCDNRIAFTENNIIMLLPQEHGGFCWVPDSAEQLALPAVPFDIMSMIANTLDHFNDVPASSRRVIHTIDNMSARRMAEDLLNNPQALLQALPIIERSLENGTSLLEMEPEEESVEVNPNVDINDFEALDAEWDRVLQSLQEDTDSMWDMMGI